MIFRVSILVFASLAAAAVSPINSKHRLKKKHSMLTGKGCSSTKEMQDEGTKVVDSKHMETELNPELDREYMIGNTDVEHSQLETRKLILERKLLELYGLAEKLSCITCLQKNLDDKTTEIDKLNFSIFALRDEIRDLKEIIRKGSLEVKHLEMEKNLMVELQMKNGNDSQMKRQISVLQEQLCVFAANETSAQYALIKKRLEAIKGIELQVLEMRRINKELELEKREILVKLYDARAKVSALSDMREIKTIAKISELRHANGNLMNEVERLQKSRFAMVEELVYQRWLSACLKAEIKQHQASSRKTLQEQVQKASDPKPSKIITQFPYSNSTLSYTSSTDSEETDSSTMDSSSNSISGTVDTASWRSTDGPSVVSSPKKSHRISSDRNSSVRKLSTSVLPSNTSMLSAKLGGTKLKKNVPVPEELTATMVMPNLTKVWRVESFSSAKIVLEKSVEGVLDEKGIVSLVTEDKSSANSVVEPQSAMAGEKHEFPSSEVSLVEPNQSSDPNRRSIDKNGGDSQEVSRIANARPEGGQHSSISNVIPTENRTESLINPHVFALLFFVFVLLLCLLHVPATMY